jgi:hypothetical protein
MAGGIIIVVAMVLAIPIAVFVGGLIWSALMGQVLVEDARERYDGREELEQHLW